MTGNVEVKVSELSGAALDWAVGYAVRWHDRDSRDSWARDWLRCYSPSSDWAHGGPLIEKYRIDLIYERESCIAAYLCFEDGRPATDDVFGPTHLIAACRAIVASVLGPVVSVPKELV